MPSIIEPPGADGNPPFDGCEPSGEARGMTASASLRRRSTPFVLACAATLATACDPGGGGGGGRRDAGRPGEQPFQCVDTLDNDGDGLADCLDPDCAGVVACEGVDAGPRPDVGPSPDVGLMACEGTSVTTDNQTQPVDIVWVIDNSGSMSDEARIVQSNIETFARSIESSGLDWRVVMMTRAGFVTVPASLASDARFRFVDVDVQSNEPLEEAVNNFGMYSDFLRPAAYLHFVFVTDDESDMPASEFRTRMRALTRQPYKAHVIASPPGSMHCMFGGFCLEGCADPDGDAAANGDVYWELALATSGSSYSICTNDWSALFRD
ncbi:MAG: hypothetical protein OHK0013_12870 [Sandaracinaceae bacterium]